MLHAPTAATAPPELQRSLPAAPRPLWVPRALRLGALLVCLAASAGPSAHPQPVEKAWSAVEALVGTPRCRVDADCKAIGVGARACGGPERYLAWSTRSTDGARLAAAVARHARLREAADAKAGLASTCVVAEEPAVRCQRDAGQDWGRCVALPGATGPTGSATQK